jgi:hypothetical protein
VITSTCRSPIRPAVNTLAVAGSRAGSGAPSSPIRGVICSAATTRRRASTGSQPNRSPRAAVVVLYPRSANVPRRCSAATVSTTIRSSWRAVASHTVSAETSSSSLAVFPVAARSACTAWVARRCAASSGLLDMPRFCSNMCSNASSL